jgi:hypothetical protein
MEKTEEEKGTNLRKQEHNLNMRETFVTHSIIEPLNVYFIYKTVLLQDTNFIVCVYVYMCIYMFNCIYILFSHFYDFNFFYIM